MNLGDEGMYIGKLMREYQEIYIKLKEQLKEDVENKFPWNGMYDNREGLIKKLNIIKSFNGIKLK